MPTSQRFTPSFESALLTLQVLVLALTLGLSSTTQAAEFGRARVLSALGSPLHINIPVTGLTMDDDRALTVRLADLESWTRAGLRPPAPLDSMQATLIHLLDTPESGQATPQRILQVTSGEPSHAPSVDLLLVVQTSAQSKLVQFSVLFPQPGLARPLSPTLPVVGVPKRASGAALASDSTGIGMPVSAVGQGRMVIQRGQTLTQIALAHPVTQADYYQQLVALWQANPEAFIVNNMNLVRAGRRLTLPAAAAVRAVDPNEARRIYQQQLEAHAAYRAQMGKSAGLTAVGARVAGDRGQVDAGVASAVARPAALGERLQLSDGEAADAASDRQAVEKLALDDAASKVEQLNRNVQALSQLNQAAGGGPIDGLTAKVDQIDAAAITAAGLGDASHGASPAPNAGQPGNLASSTEGGDADGGSTGVLPRLGVKEGVDNKGGASFMAASGLPAWLTDNLLIVLTAILAIIAFIIAWVVRRAAARNENDTGEDDDTPAPLDLALIDKRLSTIDLDLHTPPSDTLSGEHRRP
jgi:pilus assembly protein FimV